MMVKRALKRTAHAALHRFGYDVTRVREAKPDPRCEGFHEYLAAARAAGEDVNDWQESVLGWEPASPLLHELVFPYLDSGSCVCELGSGTGRHARHIVPRLKHGTLHLFDHSAWIQSFLKDYFAAHHNVVIHDHDGGTLDVPSGCADVVFSNGTLVEMKLSTIFWCAQEFARVLKQQGRLIFDYVDISTDEGWRHLESESAKYRNCYAYHCGSTIDRLFAEAGFALTRRFQEGKSTYVIFTKE